jgi:DNA-binding HxlR family transcriptional regulator
MVPLRKNRAEPPPRECALSNCINFLSKTWAASVVWYLGETPRRFNELKYDLEGISAKMLAVRLKELQEAGIVLRHERPTSPPTVEYELTALGCELLLTLRQFVNIGHKLKAEGHAL